MGCCFLGNSMRCDEGFMAGFNEAGFNEAYITSDQCK